MYCLVRKQSVSRDLFLILHELVRKMCDPHHYSIHCVNDWTISIFLRTHSTLQLRYSSISNCRELSILVDSTTFSQGSTESRHDTRLIIDQFICHLTMVRSILKHSRISGFEYFTIAMLISSVLFVTMALE